MPSPTVIQTIRRRRRPASGSATLRQLTAAINVYAMVSCSAEDGSRIGSKASPMSMPRHWAKAKRIQKVRRRVRAGVIGGPSRLVSRTSCRPTQAARQSSPGPMTEPSARSWVAGDNRRPSGSKVSATISPAYRNPLPRRLSAWGPAPSCPSRSVTSQSCRPTLTLELSCGYLSQLFSRRVLEQARRADSTRTRRQAR